MRKPRDLAGELKALHDTARELKTRKVEQLGELVITTGADSLSADELAGALIVLAATKDTAMKEAWAKRGAAFFQSRALHAASYRTRWPRHPFGAPRCRCASDDVDGWGNPHASRRVELEPSGVCQDSQCDRRLCRSARARH